MWLSTFAESAPLWLHAVLSAVLCLLVRGAVPDHTFELIAYSLSAVLLAIPLLGDFGTVLRTDPAREWVEALPVRKSEVALTRALLMLTSVSLLALASLLPVALLAPSTFSVLQRVTFVLSGIAQAICLAATLLALQSLLRGALANLLVLLQTLLVGGAVVGTVAGLRFIPQLKDIALDDPRLALYPPTWFVSGDWRLFAALAIAVLVLVVSPAPPEERASNRLSLADRLLLPFRKLASVLWVRKDERAAFDLVYDVLPREREFVIRTYPMLGIPLAFLMLGIEGESGVERDVMLAVLLFTPAAYMPVLLTHIPASRTPEASWILETSPTAPAAIANGALKAVAVRFVLPLFVMLSAVSTAFAGFEFTLRVALPGALVTLLVMRRLYPSCACGTPLSRGLMELEHDQDLMKSMIAQSLVLPILGIAAWKFASGPAQVLILVSLLVLAEWIHDRFWREKLLPSPVGE